MQNDMAESRTVSEQKSITPLGCNLDEHLLFVVNMICGHDMTLLRSLHLCDQNKRSSLGTQTRFKGVAN
jgi:hypothetical protein